MDEVAKVTDWLDLTRRCGFASHRLVGWIFWDPVAIAKYEGLGVRDALGYYVATRASTLAPAGSSAVAAAFYSIHPDFVRLSLEHCRAATTFEAAASARDEAVVEGLRRLVPEICDGLGALAAPLWEAADSLPSSGRVLFGSLLDRERPDDPVLSAWLAVNCIREWRGDTHWAIHAAEGLGSAEAGVLDGAWRAYENDWVARSRGSDDSAIGSAYAELERRGLAENGAVNEAGIRYRQALEDRLDELCVPGWRALGQQRCARYLELVEPVGARLMRQVDETAGPLWMPAGRDRRPLVDDDKSGSG